MLIGLLIGLWILPGSQTGTHAVSGGVHRGHDREVDRDDGSRINISRVWWRRLPGAPSQDDRRPSLPDVHRPIQLIARFQFSVGDVDASPHWPRHRLKRALFQPRMGLQAKPGDHDDVGPCTVVLHGGATNTWAKCGQKGPRSDYHNAGAPMNPSMTGSGVLAWITRPCTGTARPVPMSSTLHLDVGPDCSQIYDPTHKRLIGFGGWRTPRPPARPTFAMNPVATAWVRSHFQRDRRFNAMRRR